MTAVQLRAWAAEEWEASRGKWEPPWSGLTNEARAAWILACEQTAVRLLHHAGLTQEGTP